MTERNQVTFLSFSKISLEIFIGVFIPSRNGFYRYLISIIVIDDAVISNADAENILVPRQFLAIQCQYITC
ncbi:hypothetical protein A2881_05215 [Candidatus Peribacteria bacterium RIFCSPHIGHO2_01_FULL_55_13]|nr:MAG: hypothetical protein A2881_05215 [Candidatus Peribacteria bacterium RIFCSPHIGHO2_01_FULL_55_13]OGJ65655.1 MAG: hypothetical protein A3F36_04075 [Candidatus Peribacteria bacterium RIFCSPHIGHO2_12_FULL_55_11]